jgi:hypothetical protein
MTSSCGDVGLAWLTASFVLGALCGVCGASILATALQVGSKNQVQTDASVTNRPLIFIFAKRVSHI